MIINNITPYSTNKDIYFQGKIPPGITKKIKPELSISRKRIDRERIAELADKGYNDVQIAKELGVNHSSIYKARKALGIPSKIAPQKIDYDSYDYYYLRILIDEGNSLSQIAEYYKKSPSTIRKVLQHFGLKTQQATLAAAVKKEELNRLIMSGKTQEEIARELFIEDNETITHLIKKFGLETPIHKIDKYLSIDKIADRIFEGMTPKDIAGRYKISESLIIDKMKKYGLYEVYKCLYQPHDIPVQEIIDFIKDGYTISEIAEMNHISIPQMVQYMKKNKIIYI